MFEEDGGGDVHYSSACAGLGQVYYLKGQIPQAIRWYEKALTADGTGFRSYQNTIRY